MGRKEDPIWAFFKKIDVDGRKRAQCTQCLEDIVPLVERMRSHQDKCKSPAGFKGTKQVEQHAIDLQLTRMIVATNSSFNAANNKQLKKLVAMLKPGAIIPDRRNIGGNLLDEIYEEEQAKVKHLISGMSATIAIDGWSTITNQPIIGICIYAAGNCYLVDTIDTTGDSHTTEFLVDLLLHQIEEIQEKWEVNITSVVSDNAANMAAMRTRIKELDQKLHTYGCHAHIANLLVKDVLNTTEFKSVSGKIMAVLKFLKHTHAGSSALAEKKLPRPNLPCETRWNSYLDSFSYFVTHWSSIAEIVNESGLTRTALVYRNMEEIQLKRSASDALAFLKPLGDALDRFQSDCCTIGEAYEIWRKIAQQTPDQFAIHLEKRRKMAINPVVLAANLLDHRYTGNELSPLEVQEAMEYIGEMDELYLAETSKLIARDQPFVENLFKEAYKELKPDTWWKSGVKMGFNPAFAEAAGALVASVASSAGLERQFSTLGMSYGKLRANLDSQKAGKLAFLYRQLNV